MHLWFYIQRRHPAGTKLSVDTGNWANICLQLTRLVVLLGLLLCLNRFYVAIAPCWVSNCPKLKFAQFQSLARFDFSKDILSASEAQQVSGACSTTVSPIAQVPRHTKPSVDCFLFFIINHVNGNSLYLPYRQKSLWRWSCLLHSIP